MPAKKRKSVPRAPQDEAPSLVALHGGYCGLERLSVLPCSHGWQTAEPERDPEGRPGVYTQEETKSKSSPRLWYPSPAPRGRGLMEKGRG